MGIIGPRARGWLRLPGDGRGDVYAALAVAGLACAFLWELWTFVGVPVARDMQVFFVPQRFLLWEAFQSGTLPLWTPHIGMGAPLLANLQSGVFYPPHWLFAALPFLPAFNLIVVLHFALGGVGAYLLARALDLTLPASLAVAVVFMLGGYFASLLNLINAQQAAAWSPLMAWAALRHLERRALASFGVLAFVFLMGLLAGEPQTFLLGALFAGLLVALRWPVASSAGRQLSLALSFGAAAVWVAGLSLVQLLPTAELIAESTRGGEGLSFDEASFYSLLPVRLPHLLLPADYRDPVYRFGFKALIGSADPWLFSVYVGALAPLLFAFAWRVRRFRREAAWLSASFAVGLLLALGPHTPVYGWLFDGIPGFGAFRFPEKYFFFCGMSAALLSGLAVEAMREREWRRFDGRIALTLLAVLLVARVAVSSNRERVLEAVGPQFVTAMQMDSLEFAYRLWLQNLDKWIFLLALGVGLVWLYRRKVLARPLFTGALLALLATDFAVAHRMLNPTVEPAFYEMEPLISRYLPMDELRLSYRYRATGFDERAGTILVVQGIALEAQKWMWQHTFQPNTSQLRRILQVDTWDAIKLRGFVDELSLHRALPDTERRWRLLALTSVKYAYSLRRLHHGGFERETPIDSLPGYLYEVPDPLPRAYVATRPRYYADDMATVNGMLSADFAPLNEVALIDPERAEAALPAQSAPGERHPGPASDPVTEAAEGTVAAEGAEPAAADSAAAAPAPAPRATIESDTGEEVRVRVDVTAPGYLVLTDSYYPGWEATVDGELREIRLANFFFRAVRVEPGDREVVFRYRSRPLELGARLSGAWLALGLIGLGWAGRRRRRRRP